MPHSFTSYVLVGRRRGQSAPTKRPRKNIETNLATWLLSNRIHSAAWTAAQATANLKTVAVETCWHPDCLDRLASQLLRPVGVPVYECQSSFTKSSRLKVSTLWKQHNAYSQSKSNNSALTCLTVPRVPSEKFMWPTAESTKRS
jgi:hypothetical protein